jgi:DNA-3-methyladenine glycosylase I
MTNQTSNSTVKGDDGNKRCAWCVSDSQYMKYHDTEWGKPVTDDQNFREAFANFDPEEVALFKARDITRLMKNEGIVRNRLKIEATIANAKATLKVQDELGTLSSLIWSFAPTKSKKAPRTLSDIPATSPESVALSKELLKRGFKFVGPTTMYAAMQSLGLVNDHLATCFARDTTK